MAFGQKNRDRNNPLPTKGRTTITGQIKRLVLFALPLLVLGGGIAGFATMGALKPKPETKTEAPRATPVITAKAEARTVELNVSSQGEVRPRTEINLASQIGGKIAFVSGAFLDGGQFNKGDVLLRIESADYDLRVTQAQANVAQAQTVLTRELSESEIARRDWEDLGQGKASPLSLREPQLAEARARLAASQAGLDEALLQQSRTTLRAPFTGRMREKTVSVAEYITPGQKLARIYAVDIADVKLPLTDADLAKLGLGIGFKSSPSNPGPDVTFTATVSGISHTWHGRLTRTDSGYDTQTRTLYGYAVLKDPYGKGADNGTPLASGMFVEAKIAGKTTINTIIVPRNALRGADKVYIANTDNTLSIRTVDVSSSNREFAVLASGLYGGENVIISPIRGVADGMPIEIATPTTQDTKL